MTGRPALVIGGYGKITVTRTGPSAYRARARFRDPDGKARIVERRADTRGRAERALRETLAGRATGDSGRRGSVRVSTLADAWLKAPHRWSARTREMYTYAIGRYVLPTIGNLTAQEATIERVQDALVALEAEHGPSAAATARSVMSGIFKQAAQRGVLQVNPVQLTAAPRVKRSRPRSLTRAQVDEIVDAFRANQRAVDLDLPDLVEFMLGTGCRLGEALAVRDADSAGHPLLILDDAGTVGTVEIAATAIRIKAQGMWVQEHPKSTAGHRTLALPPHLVAMLNRRRSELRPTPNRVQVIDIDDRRLSIPDPGMMFPAPAAKRLRDPSNTEGNMREALNAVGCEKCAGGGFVVDADGLPVLHANRRPVRCDGVGPYEWVTSHTFRKTVATWLHEAGVPGNEISEQIGHAQMSTTQNLYFGRPVVTEKAAQVLER